MGSNNKKNFKLKQSTFTQIYNEYYDRLVKYVMKILKNKEYCFDIVQNVFVDLPRIVMKYKSKLGEFETLLFTCARHETFNYLKKVKNYNKRIDSIDDVADFYYENTFLSIDLKLLNPKEFECIYLEYIQGLKAKEINRIMNISNSTRQRIKKAALSKLKKQICD